MKKISIIFGTRPEAIKMAPVINTLKNNTQVELSVCFTGQHKEMVLPLLDFFEISVDFAPEIMQPAQTLAGLTSRSIIAIDEYFRDLNPSMVLVQGDTTTAMSAAVAAFYRKIPIGHIEAGLRTNDISSPFPEEFNRQMISRVSSLHFAPTTRAAENLIREGIDKRKVFMTGNTVIDALLFTVDKLDAQPEKYASSWLLDDLPFILITGHRRENFGKGFENICLAIKTLANKYPHIRFVYPVHLNPNVQEPVKRILNESPNVCLIPPLDYIDFVKFMRQSLLILTDSGGVQEEAPTFGKPVLIMRNNTERPEAVEAGSAKIVGTDTNDIVENVSLLLDDEQVYLSMSSVNNVFGDGLAAERIADKTIEYEATRA